MITAIHTALRTRRERLENDEAGFTLIELLVVVLIIGVLAAIAIPVYLSVQSNAKDSAVKADLTNIATAVVAYQTQNSGALPASMSDLTSVSINASNYTATGQPTLTVSGSGSTAKFCAVATGTNNNTWHVTDKQSPTSGACPTS